MADAKKEAPPPTGLLAQASELWSAYNGAFAWCAAITISCALGGVMGGIRSGNSLVRGLEGRIGLGMPRGASRTRFAAAFGAGSISEGAAVAAISAAPAAGAAALAAPQAVVGLGLWRIACRADYACFRGPVQGTPPNAYLAATAANGAAPRGALPALGRAWRLAWPEVKVPMWPCSRRPARLRCCNRCLSTPAAWPASERPVAYRRFAAALPARPDKCLPPHSALGILLQDAAAVSHRRSGRDRHRGDADPPRRRLL